MRVVGFAGYSGAGKTTLLEQVVRLLATGGARVAVIKHAHHRFDIDHEGKDSWRHRKAGAQEVLVVSDIRMALMREFLAPREPEVHALIAEIDPATDWLLVEGFRGSDLPKIEVWRAPSPDFDARPARYPDDPQVRAICTDATRDRLPVPTDLPLLDWTDAPAVVAWMQAHAAAFDYCPPAGASAS
ncbi:molybdopterin-guanine dinucleotide biosynthesis protein B [uncultured Xylophilus sp.]|uniref:molybdopterin-guanine dinucleotide biosynthesis protein B n=1 Tax=uncultured Xylophilus sp. TaxID=296832 RepID=UPI0025E73E83|nr:molybdopterin-guanine dinucleotide biosynthesis protein B [uncultured Xylophilus sp.]